MSLAGIKTSLTRKLIKTIAGKNPAALKIFKKER